MRLGGTAVKMSRNLLAIGSLLLVAVVAAALVVQPNNNDSNDKGSNKVSASGATSGVIGSSTSPDGAPAQVRASGRAVADPLSLHVLRSYTTREIKNQYVPSTAHGIYLVMDVSATNEAGHTVTFDGQIALNLDGTRYSPSTTALTALDLSGHSTFAESDLEPSASTTGWVAFDVPAGAVASNPQLCLVQRGADHPPLC